MSQTLQSFQGIDSRGLRLLSLDGGGIRGLSSLLILKEIMGRIKRDERLTEVPRPCDYFDVIGGTSTGGLIAIMLGRLRMPISDAIKAYVLLSDQIFSERKHRWQEGKFKVVETPECLIHYSEITPSPGVAGLRFVCALTRDNMEAKIPVHFRTYDSAWNPMPNCMIWEAARATSAAPTFFKSMTIKDEEEVPYTFVDGGLAVNNPTVRVLLEAKDVFPGRPLSSILSIGTGQAKTISMSKPSAVSNAFVPDLQLTNAVKRMATECEKVADEMAGRFVKYPGVYFRFSVEQGMQDIGLGAFERLNELAAHTSAYMRLHENDMRANHAASALKSTRPWARVSIDEVAY